ncbi:MAG: YvrJ family protein [Aminivibrio sp.]|jgi:hypothetical protein
MDVEFLTAAGTAAFPAAVAAYLLLRLEKRLEDLSAAIEKLRHCQTCVYDLDDV